MKRILFLTLLLAATPVQAEQLFLSAAGSNVIHFLVEDTSKGSTDPDLGLTGLSSSTTGFEIHFACDTEATDTDYTVAGSTIESIITLGTFAAPTATKIRFKEYDSTDMKGVYEAQVDNARVITTARSCIISWKGGTNVRSGFKEIPVLAANPSCNVTQFNGTNATTSTAGVPLVDVGRWNNNAVTGSGPTGNSSGVGRH